MSVPSLSERIQARFPQAVIARHAWRGDDTVTVRRENLLEVARALRDDPEFRMNFLMDLTAVDYKTFTPPADPTGAFVNAGIRLKQPMNVPDPAPWPDPATAARFEVVYHFFSVPLNHRVRVKVPVEEADPVVDSLTPLWGSADWFEREVWDMVGVRFRGHPNLKRLLMYAEFNGHPLRKDYPVNQRQPLIGPVN